MLTRIVKGSLVVVASAALVGLGANARAADTEKPVSFGVQADWSSDADFGAGARVIVDLNRFAKNLEAVGSFDYFFPSSGVTGVDLSYWEANANAVYKLDLKGTSVRPYLGAGLNIAHAKGGVGIDLGAAGSFDYSVAETKAGLNILGGLLFGKGKQKFFAEARGEAGGGKTFVVTAGVRF